MWRSTTRPMMLKPEELLPRLARLAAPNWPYGRVVALAVDKKSSENDGVATRRTKGIIGGMLHSANIAIKWVPSA